MKKQTISADSVVALLAEKHAKDVFVQECKDGPSQCSTHCRLDAWATNRSWSSACSFGYEVKVSRSDFLNDRKWPQYLPYCNEFYFVAPQDLIDPSELSAECGLIVVSKTNTRLFTKKKAPRRDVVIPEDFYRYILMCRVEIKSEWKPNNGKPDRAFWEAWAAEKKIDAVFGYYMGKTIKEAVKKRIIEVEEKQDQLERQMKTYEDIRSYLKSMGVDPDKKYLSREDANLSKHLMSLKYQLESTNQSLQRLYKHIIDQMIERGAQPLDDSEIDRLMGLT